MFDVSGKEVSLTQLRAGDGEVDSLRAHATRWLCDRNMIHGLGSIAVFFGVIAERDSGSEGTDGEFGIRFPEFEDSVPG